MDWFLYDRDLRQELIKIQYQEFVVFLLFKGAHWGYQIWKTSSINNYQIALYYHFIKVIKGPGTSF